MPRKGRPTHLLWVGEQRSYGNVINCSKIQVRDLMAELRQKAFETAVQMRIDSTPACRISVDPTR